MAALVIKSFGGISPKLNPRYLPDNGSQVAINCPVFAGSLQSLLDVGGAVHTLAKTTLPRTIYRYGQDTVADDRYWFHWSHAVDVCRSQVAGDVSEWTFYTGDGAPKMTYNQLALGGNNYPQASRPLGLPAPTTTATATAQAFASASHPAKLVLTKYMLDALVSTTTPPAAASYAVGVSLTDDEDGAYTTLAVSSKSATSVATALDGVAGLIATVSGDTVTVTTEAEGVSAKLLLRLSVGTTPDVTGVFTPFAVPRGEEVAGTVNTNPYIIITDAEIGSIAANDRVRVMAGNTVYLDFACLSQPQTAGELAAMMNTANSGTSAGEIHIIALGSCVLVRHLDAVNYAETLTYERRIGGATAPTDGTPASVQHLLATLLLRVFGIASPSSTPNYGLVTTISATGSESGAPATIFIDQTDIDLLACKYASLTVNGTEHRIAVPLGSTIGAATRFASYGVSVTTHGSISPMAVIKTTVHGGLARLKLRGGNYPEIQTYAKQAGVGYADTASVPETRVYAWTWVNKEAGFDFESAPSPASNSVDVQVGQAVNLSGFPTTAEGETVVTHKRIYRATSGVYLFVAEILASATSYADSVTADELGEEMTTLNWLPPKDDLKGLVNLPNGLMAGFTGRDVYFCDPYHPHAWPLEYAQAVDYPIVGLGTMDTTLAVLTTGTPFFIQGTHPENMAVVKGGIEQACVSRRSIVSGNGAVIYASPDGLVMLSPGGSKLLTEQLFTRAQWQGYKPESIHAYQHDMKYVAFYNTGSVQGGFIFDMQSGQFILHDIYAECGFHDVQRDELFLAFADRTVKKWMGGAAKAYQWRSKKFSLPTVAGFSCAKLEAEAYPMTLKVYTDGALTHTQTVTSRNAFRLPPAQGRDWELEITGESEVFSVAVAQSMTELASS